MKTASISLVFAAMLVAAVAAGCLQGGPYGSASTPAATPEPTAVVSPAGLPAATATAEPTASPSPAATAQATPGPTATATPAATAKEARVIGVEGNDFSFNPSTMTVSPGESVKVAFNNNGAYPHTFTITKLGVDTGRVAPGGSAEVSFTAPATPGSYEVTCTIPGHVDRGMVGTLQVQ